jgi:hypothetical protein
MAAPTRKHGGGGIWKYRRAQVLAACGAMSRMIRRAQHRRVPPPRTVHNDDFGVQIVRQRNIEKEEKKSAPQRNPLLSEDVMNAPSLTSPARPPHRRDDGDECDPEKI